MDCYGAHIPMTRTYSIRKFSKDEKKKFHGFDQKTQKKKKLYGNLLCSFL